MSKHSNNCSRSRSRQTLNLARFSQSCSRSRSRQTLDLAWLSRSLATSATYIRGSYCSANAKSSAGWIAVGLVLIVSLQCGWINQARAQSAEQTPPAAEATTPPIVAGQKSVAERFGRLEMLLLRSADLEAADNPTRAALLQQAVQLSKQAELTALLVDAAARLEQGQYSEAIEKQKSSRENLKRLLELLQSENREERIREQRDEVRRWIEETDRLLRLQSSLRGRTEGGQDIEQAAQDQEKLTRKATDIAEELQTSQPDQKSSQSAEGAQSAPSPDKSSDSPKDDSASEAPPEKDDADKEDAAPEDTAKDDSEPSDSKPSDSEPSDSEPSDSEPSDSEPSDSKPSDSKPSDSKPSDSEPSDSEPSDSEPSAQAAQDEPTPAQSPTERAKQKIEQAQQKMQEAEQELKQAEREGAVEKQREAEERLREAIEELEEILRQLREEEVERSLASLETRLRRMLDMQNRVLEETTRLQEIAGDGAERQIQITASKLSLDQLKILSEGERALLLLRDEGSSAAFPEAIDQLNVDIQSVADRLQGADVGPLTVVIESEIVSSLEEMVEALVQVQKENREKQQQQQQQPGQPPGEPGEQPLVDKLAELRLIRTLQVRINNRTNTLSDMLDDPADPTGQVTEQDLVDQLQGLATRQLSIQRVTRDIVVGKGE